MDGAGPALRLLKRRLKPISRAELRALPASPRHEEGPKIDWPGYPPAGNVPSAPRGPNLGSKAGSMQGSKSSLQPLPASKDLKEAGTAQTSTKMEVARANARTSNDLAPEASALSFVLLRGSGDLHWKLHGKMVQLLRPGTTLEPRSYHLLGGAMEVGSHIVAGVTDPLLPILRQAVLEAQNLCIWLHGPRGSGKSRLMWGSLQDARSSRPGLAENLANGVFQTLKELKLLPIQEGDDRVLVTLQFLKFGVETELCGDCLVGPDFDPRLKMREALLGNSFVMEGAQEQEVRQPAELFAALQRGVQALRCVGSFPSGRCRKEDVLAHGLCTFRIRRRLGTAVHTSTIHLLDLVGAEMSADVKVKKRSHKEDRTLKAILRVVDTLAQDPEYKFRDGHTAPRHIPHRDSKVTRLLRPCLGMSGRSVLLALPVEGYDATLSALELATRHEGMAAGPLESCIFDRDSKMREIDQEVAKLCQQLGLVEISEMHLTMDASDDEVRLAELLQLRRRVLSFEDWLQIRQASEMVHRKTKVEGHVKLFFSTPFGMDVGVASD